MVPSTTRSLYSPCSISPTIAPPEGPYSPFSPKSAWGRQSFPLVPAFRPLLSSDTKLCQHCILQLRISLQIHYLPTSWYRHALTCLDSFVLLNTRAALIAAATLHTNPSSAYLKSNISFLLNISRLFCCYSHAENTYRLQRPDVPALACRSCFPNTPGAPPRSCCRDYLAIVKPPQQANASFDAMLLAFDTDEDIKQHLKTRI